MLAPKGTHDATQMKILFLQKKLMEYATLQEPRMLIEGWVLKPFIVGGSTIFLLQ